MTGVRLGLLARWRGAASETAQASQASVLAASLQRLQLQGTPVRVLTGVTAGQLPAAWYCQGPGPCWYRADAQWRWTWRGWQLCWQLQALDQQQLWQALQADPQTCHRVFGKLRGRRLYA
jgi:hypothetical protein